MVVDPLISVVMLSYNSENYIGESVASILEQSYANFELLIFDDYSQDQTLTVVREFNDPRIHIVEHSQKLSIPHLRNEGIDLSNGKYLAIMDSDDIAPSYRLEDQVVFLESHKDIDVVGGDYLSTSTKAQRRIVSTDFPSDHESIIYSFLFRCLISNSTSMYRLEKIRETGIRYRVEYPVCSDFAFWIDLVSKVKFQNLKGKPYQYYRTRHKESITTQTTKDDEQLNLRNQFVNQMRRKLFDVLGLSISNDEYSLFCKFFSYLELVNSVEEYRQLEGLFSKLKFQANHAGLNTNKFNAILDHWLHRAWQKNTERNV